MNYEQTLDYLFNALPMFQRIGAAAFTKDLSNTIALCTELGNPEKKFKSIHIAGTNGKGSTSHALCSVLMEAGYKVGLYTSPHLKSFTERVKINGQEIPQHEVVDFVVNQKDFLDKLKPSFFEMTVGLAFWYFAKEKVDIAVIEVGMGGRFDSTNVLMPELAVITNIGYDHMQFLGDTLPKIAGEKAGIIKENVPVVISQKQKETTTVFEEIARKKNAPIYYAEDFLKVIKRENVPAGVYEVISATKQITIELDLKGNYQQMNLYGILQALKVLQGLGHKISQNHIKNGLIKVIKNTGLKGRWQQLSTNPMTICDTGHNEDGIRYIVEQLHEYNYNHLFIIIGMVNDKDVSKVLLMLPKDAYYFFVQANIPRAMTATDLYSKAKEAGLTGEVIEDVNNAIATAKKKALKNDLIFIGGSTFVVAEIKEL